MTSAEGDRIARMVLRLVTELVEGAVREDPRAGELPETTGTGHLDDDVRDYVMKRSA